ncbi:MAG: 2OG-Fe(II) oxygenase [Acidobacteriota bacterium]
MNPSNPASGPRSIDLEILLQGGHRQQLALPEDSPLLAELFQALASSDGRFLQLPIQDGRGACSFHASQLVSVLSRPPVVLDLDQTATASATSEVVGPQEVTIQQPRFAVIEDFLSPVEYRSLLDWTLEHREQFEPGTVEGQRHEHRENLVVFDFGYTAQANLLKSRLLTWFPFLCRRLELPVFPLLDVESQLTAANDGQYYRIHDDAGHESVTTRELTCVYYFHREPKAFEGGELRLYDTELGPEGRRPAPTFRILEPVANRMVVFASDSFHEVRTVHCPSHDFSDSRFAVTHWLRRRDQPDPEARFGWGQMRCGVVPEAFARRQRS